MIYICRCTDWQSIYCLRSIFNKSKWERNEYLLALQMYTMYISCHWKSYFCSFFFFRFTSLAKLFWKKEEIKILSLAMNCLRLSFFFLFFYIFNQSFRICLENYHNCFAAALQALAASRPIQFIENYMHVYVFMSVYVYMSLYAWYKYILRYYNNIQLQAFILHFNSFCVENRFFAFKSHYNFNFQHVFSHFNFFSSSQQWMKQKEIWIEWFARKICEFKCEHRNPQMR